MKRTLEEIKENIRKVHGDKYDLSYLKLVPYKEPLTILCPEHGFLYPTYDNFVNKKSECPYCRGLKRKTTEEFVAELKEIFGDEYLYDNVEYINARTDVVLICPKHGEFSRTPNKLLNRRLGCPKCQYKSKLESIVENALKHNNIEYTYNKRFKFLSKQSIDFFLSDYQIGIECQGEQHFRQVFFNGKKDDIEERNTFERIVERDVEKYRLCTENNVRLLYFIDKDIDDSLIMQDIYKHDNSFKYVNDLIAYIKINYAE